MDKRPFLTLLAALCLLAHAALGGDLTVDGNITTTGRVQATGFRLNGETITSWSNVTPETIDAQSVDTVALKINGTNVSFGGYYGPWAPNTVLNGIGLSSVGAGQSLVSDGLGESLAIKSLVASGAVSLVTTSTNITIIAPSTNDYYDVQVYFPDAKTLYYRGTNASPSLPLTALAFEAADDGKVLTVDGSDVANPILSWALAPTASNALNADAVGGISLSGLDKRFKFDWYEGGAVSGKDFDGILLRNNVDGTSTNIDGLAYLIIDAGGGTNGLADIANPNVFGEDNYFKKQIYISGQIVPYSSGQGNPSGNSAGNWGWAIPGRNNSAVGGYSAVGGGIYNSAGGNYAAVGGGTRNIAGSNPDHAYSFIPGGYSNNISAPGSFAIGSHLKVSHANVGIIGHGSATNAVSSAATETLVLWAPGNVGVNTNNPLRALHVDGTVRATRFEDQDGNAVSASDVSNLVQTNHNGDVEVTGTVTATSFVGDGSGLTGVSPPIAGESNVAVRSDGGTNYIGVPLTSGWNGNLTNATTLQGALDAIDDLTALSGGIYVSNAVQAIGAVGDETNAAQSALIFADATVSSAGGTSVVAAAPVATYRAAEVGRFGDDGAAVPSTMMSTNGWSIYQHYNAATTLSSNGLDNPLIDLAVTNKRVEVSSYFSMSTNGAAYYAIPYDGRAILTFRVSSPGISPTNPLSSGIDLRYVHEFTCGWLSTNDGKFVEFALIRGDGVGALHSLQKVNSNGSWSATYIDGGAVMANSSAESSLWHGEYAYGLRDDGTNLTPLTFNGPTLMMRARGGSAGAGVGWNQSRTNWMAAGPTHFIIGRRTGPAQWLNYLSNQGPPLKVFFNGVTLHDY